MIMCDYLKSLILNDLDNYDIENSKILGQSKLESRMMEILHDCTNQSINHEGPST